ncbi:hypothetical protein BQ9231_00460 [Cedratvirus lausannensis]|uniref:Uncharacterized protein n=1 Tax=Cedratvirus lausannensis TaxID=2023205 RepID=A0A285PXE4_9VIRU|nr:hypothetical protein BQ9231_00460 [Cedratvirus lausannensis]
MQEIENSLTDPASYFTFFPPGYVSKDLARFFSLPQSITMEILTNSLLSYSCQHKLLQEDKIKLNPELKSVLNTTQDSLPLSDLPLFLSGLFRLRKSRKEQDIFILASRVRERVKRECAF